MGYPEQNNKLISELVRKHGFIVYSPEYTLSIDKPYPAALNDVLSAYKYMLYRQKKCGQTNRPVIIGGESAGGGLACSLTIYLRDHGQKLPDLPYHSIPCSMTAWKPNP